MTCTVLFLTLCAVVAKMSFLMGLTSVYFLSGTNHQTDGPRDGGESGHLLQHELWSEGGKLH